jgi:hypothetical protein
VDRRAVLGRAALTAEPAGWSLHAREDDVDAGVVDPRTEQRQVGSLASVGWLATHQGVVSVPTDVTRPTFNGDIADHHRRWELEVDDGADVCRLATRIARKTLLAVAGLISLRDGTWSTDRRTSARRWNELEPGTPVEVLVEWLDTPPSGMAAIHDVLEGPVAEVVQAFRFEIGVWDGTR